MTERKPVFCTHPNMQAHEHFQDNNRCLMCGAAWNYKDEPPQTIIGYVGEGEK